MKRRGARTVGGRRSFALASLASFAPLGPLGLAACASFPPPAESVYGTDGGEEASTGPGSDAGAPDATQSHPDGSTAPDGGFLGGDASPDAGADAGASVSFNLDAGTPYILAPPTRTVQPVAVFTTSGNVVNPTNVLTGKPTGISGNGSYIVLDFGKEVGGIVTLAFSGSSDASQSVGLAFSESSLYVGLASDQSNGATTDGAVTAAVPGASTYTLPATLLRGGFRYLTVFLSSAGSVQLNSVSLDYSPDPDRAVPNQYPNYFYSNDDAVNKAWYAGAYTFQTNIARNSQGRIWPAPSSGWNNSGTVGELGDAVLVDGAKRDRTVWPGDMGISAPTGFASLFETGAVKNSIQTLMNHQASSGQLPFAGPMVNAGGSDTYHMWTLLGTCLYYLYSGDKAWLDSVWTQFQLGMTYSLGTIDANGLVNVAGGNAQDWARDDTGGENIEANAIFYGLLVRASVLAQVEGNATLAASYTSSAAALKTKINALLFDASLGAYKDNASNTMLYPQDGNALAVWFDVVANASQAKGLSYFLSENWNTIGSRGPEFTRGSGVPKISPFAGSMELMSHLVAGYDTRALDMIRMMWGFQLTSPNGTGSSFWEGYNADGSFAYDQGGASYTSLAHGWSTGPTSALTFYTLGVAPDSASGATFHVVPHPGDLTHVEGDLTMAAGKVVYVAYDVGGSCGSFAMRVDSTTNAGSVATLAVPTFGGTHVVLVNGAVAWNGSALVATPGVTGASMDSSYIYFTGVAPGLYTLRYTDGTACPPPPEAWTFCTDENATCAFTGTKRVRFGREGHYSYGIFTGGTPCNTTTFPDPFPSVPKSCATSDELYVGCASEGGTCTFSGTHPVRFGANGQWVVRPANGSISCDAVTFGDPIAGVAKRCEYF